LLIFVANGLHKFTFFKLPFVIILLIRDDLEECMCILKEHYSIEP